jgi:radical SAM superfamily enzyme YgiQ (UPF0313 family)
MKKILFIRPQAPGPRFPPLGILYLTAYLKKYRYSGEFNILDLRSCSLKNAQIADRINGFDPDLIGISSLSTESVSTHNLVEICRKARHGTPVLLGGPYASAEWPFAMEDSNIDHCFVGEGEQSFLEFLNCMDNGGDPKAISGLAFRDPSGKPALNPLGSFITELDEIPFPDYELIDLKEYAFNANSHLPAFDFKRRFAPIFTSRGCPYKCTFCHNIFGKKIRFRSPGNVLAEVDWLVKEHGISEIHFEDDSFNIDVKRAKTICHEIINRKYDLKTAFPNGIRADFVDEEMVDLFADMGVYNIAYGIESANENIRKKIKKTMDIEKLKKAITLTAGRGIIVSGFFMVGFPNETEKEMEETIRFACKSKLHIANFSRVIPFPGTELFDEAVRLGFNYKRELLEGVKYEDKVAINLSALSDRVLEKKIRSAMQRFYLNPGRLLRLFLVYPGKFKLVMEGLRVFKKRLLGADK